MYKTYIFTYTKYFMSYLLHVCSVHLSFINIEKKLVGIF